MEGIPVKISEKYKPPRRISLPASVQNKLNTIIQFEKASFSINLINGDSKHQIMLIVK